MAENENQDGTGGEEQTQTLSEIAAGVIVDGSLPPEDYEKARQDPTFAAEIAKKKADADDGVSGGGGDEDGAGADDDDKKVTDPPPDPPADPDEDEDDDDGDEDGKKRKSGHRGFRRRIERLMDESSEKDRKIAQMESRLAELEGGEKKPKEPPKEVALKRPKQEDFDDPDEYDTALDEYYEKRMDAKNKKFREELRAEQNLEKEKEKEKETAQGANAEIKRQFSKSREAHEDFDKVLKVVDDIEWPAPHAYVMMRSGEAGEIAYYLAQHRDEAEKIAEIKDPIELPMAIGRIVSKINAAPAPPKGGDEGKEKPPRKPPPPPVGKTVGDGSGVTKKDQAYWEQVSPEEYAQARKEGRVRL